MENRQLYDTSWKCKNHQMREILHSLFGWTSWGCAQKVINLGLKCNNFHPFHNYLAVWFWGWISESQIGRFFVHGWIEKCMILIFNIFGNPRRLQFFQMPKIGVLKCSDYHASFLRFFRQVLAFFVCERGRFHFCSCHRFVCHPSMVKDRPDLCLQSCDMNGYRAKKFQVGSLCSQNCI